MDSSTYFLFLILCGLLSYRAESATVRSTEKFEFGGKSEEQFLEEVIKRSSPGNARILAELFRGLEINLDFGHDSQAVISVGGAATKCQDQSACFDTRCNACYDPLLRIHGLCGGASYFTCRGTLPKACLPYKCTYRGKKRRSSLSDSDTTVFIKRFSRYEDQFCLDSRNTSSQSEEVENEIESPDWTLDVPDAVTPCQGYDTCLDLRCGACYDSYLGAHTTCGKMTYFDCNSNLPEECRPMQCTDTNIFEIFPTVKSNRTEEVPEKTPLMVRNFGPSQNMKLCQ